MKKLFPLLPSDEYFTDLLFDALDNDVMVELGDVAVTGHTARHVHADGQLTVCGHDLSPVWSEMSDEQLTSGAVLG